MSEPFELPKASYNKFVQIARTLKLTTPEEAAQEERDYYMSLTPEERVAVLLQIIHEWTPESERRLERTYRIVSVPPR